MAVIRTFRDVIDLWPSKRDLAADVGAPFSVVAKWWQRRSIPAERWSAILSTSVARDAGLTSDKLTELAAREPAEARQ